MVSAAVLATLTACKSKEGNDEGAKPSPPPVVIIDSTKRIYEDQDLVLFAEATDDGEIISYQWNAKDGNRNVGNKALLTITAPHTVGNHKYAISVTDDEQQVTTKIVSVTIKDSKYREGENKLKKYVADLQPDAYKLTQMNDNSFNLLSIENKYKVADKLLSSMFFAYSHDELSQRINSGTFISDIRSQLLVSSNNMNEINNKIHNSERYYQNDNNSTPEFLTRFHEMKVLDKAYLNHWVSYILTQTILFSPAVELGSVSNPDAYGVYNRLYNFQDTETGMRYATFKHMTSSENWRRFRSPEDNGREMLEIYTLNGNDADVPAAAQALKNWHLNRQGSTLVVGLNKNTEPQSILDDMHFTTGMEFYASLANSKAFTKGVTERLVDFMFTNSSKTLKDGVISKIVSSKPETWNDILAQIAFSEDYLLNTSRVKSIEELAFPLMKKLHFNTYKNTFSILAHLMVSMGQASMSYKLGKLTRVPMDNISFATYQSYLRTYLMRSWSRDTKLSLNPHAEDTDGTKNSEYIMSDYDNYLRKGISNKHFMSPDKFELLVDDKDKSRTNYINYLFNSVLHRDVKNDELAMFLEHFENNGYTDQLTYVNEEDKDYEGYIRNVGMYYIQYQVFDYFLRLDELYFFKKVEK